MSYGYVAPITGTFTSNGTSQLVDLPGYGDLLKFEVYDEGQFGSTAANTNMINAWWYKDLTDGYAFVGNKTSGAATIAITNMITSNGFTLIDPTSTQLQTAITGTTITNANPAVATATNTFAVGDLVRITNSTGMLQIAGMDFTVTAANGSTFTLGYLNASGFAAGASAFSVQKFNYASAYYPRNRLITSITQASSAVITLSVTHGFTAGQSVRIYVPSAFGMTEMNGLSATITAVNTTNNTITVNVNSSSFTAFAFPTSATAAAGVTFAQVVPIGEAATSPYQNLLDDSTVNTSAYQMYLGSSVVGQSGDTIRWFAYRGLVES